jgi:predicted phosphodiesterase
MRIAVISDTHGNLPALAAALDAITRGGYDELIHTGDAIGIGPCPEDCVALLAAMPRARCILGNHEAWFLTGQVARLPRWIGRANVGHLEWTWTRISPEARTAIAQWPYVLTDSHAGVTASFLHYARDEVGADFQHAVQHTATALERTFGAYPGGLVCFGHDHRPIDIRGRVHYLNPGSLGLHRGAIARYLVIEFHRGGYRVQREQVEYSDHVLWREFVARDVPGRAAIDREFFGGRLGRA